VGHRQLAQRHRQRPFWRDLRVGVGLLGGGQLRQRHRNIADADGALRPAVTDTNTYSNANADAYLYTNTYAHHDPNAHCESNAECYPERHSYTHSLSNSYADGYTYSDAESYSERDGNTVAYSDANT
jgi:hypothetical protein